MNIKTAYQGSPAAAAPGFELVDLTGVYGCHIA
jgi:hypothetical protein